MPKLLQIDSCLGILSTGKITESIARLAMGNGYDCYIIHGARSVGPSVQKHYQAGYKINSYLHFAESFLFDRHGLGSRIITKKLIKVIDEIKPDIVQLHCVHGYYINYKYLFEYLNSSEIPIVWTFHDCWAFTGHCAHFVTANCNKWKGGGCHNCPLLREYPKALIDHSKRNFKLKEKLFSANRNLHIVAVSEWLASFTRESFLGDKDIRVINNGVDINNFKPCSPKAEDKIKILGVASVWNKDKGLYDFYKLRELLPIDKYNITLVGLTEMQIANLPTGITGITKKNSVSELSKLYSESSVFVNPTYADSFPTVNMEALACGTPVITYRTGGSPEIIDEKTGIVIEQGDIIGLIEAIQSFEEHPLSSEACRKRAIMEYDKNARFLDYINLYNELIK